VREFHPAEAIAAYAGSMHLSPRKAHHVASPLGAWLLVALASTLAEGRAAERLAAVLGAEPVEAAEFASLLLTEPHPSVGVAAGLWNRPHGSTPALSAWKAGLPGPVESGDVPTRSWLDAWAERRSLGLITRFPIDVTALTDLVMASALATKVSWVTPFEVVPGGQLGAGSEWAGRAGVMSTGSAVGHRQHIAATAGAGIVAVHSAEAEGGLLVTSVIAAADVPTSGVVAAAHDIARSEVLGASAGGGATRISLFDLPLAERPEWRITEETVQAPAPGGLLERYESVLPAWSAESTHDLGAESSGFPLAAAALAGALGLVDFTFEAAQTAKARYGPTGFEAAAVTGLSVTRTAFAPAGEAKRRTALLRFGHPYAVVASTVAPGSPWHGVPVFSAWVAEPDEAPGARP
jgi:hypothetical protein